MIFLIRCVVIISFLLTIQVRKCTRTFANIEKQYHLVAEAYDLAKNLFNQGRTNYDNLKVKSLEAINLFLDVVRLMNSAMAREIRSAILKFYKVQYFYDFTNYAISMEEMREITEHCLVEPVEKLEEIQSHFDEIIRNFQDVRNFEQVEKCREDLPDEVATAHCILHQAVLLNELMNESLTTIVELKTKQHALEMNASLHKVQKCFQDFVPNFYDNLILDAYTGESKFLKVVNASITDLRKYNWKLNNTLFVTRWQPILKILKTKLIISEEPNLNVISDGVISLEPLSNKMENDQLSHGLSNLGYY